MFKLVKLLLTLTHLLALREEKVLAAKQKAFKERRAADHIAYRAKQRELQAKVEYMAQEAALASAHAALGSNQINEAQRVAGSLRSKLDYLNE